MTRPDHATFLGALLFFSILVGGCQPPASPPEADSAKTLPVAPRVAETGVGASTQRLEDQDSIGKAISTPAAAYFRTQEKIVFEIQLPKTMDLFRATEGRSPNSHDEFMRRIIGEGMVKLPKLPEGQMYRYHPDDGQLWVEPKSE